MSRVIIVGCLVVWLALIPTSLAQLVRPDTAIHLDSLRAANNRMRVEIQAYAVVLHGIAENPPIYDEVSDSVAIAIARAIYMDRRLTGMSAGTYLALLRVENPQLDYWVENWYGAVGLTQVVPKYWLGVYPECGDDLYGDIYTQVCYGMRVYLTYYAQYGSPETAWWAYNGCTPARRARGDRCRNFPTWINDFTTEYTEDLSE